MVSPGDTYIPMVPSATVLNIAKAMIGDRKIEIKVVGIRPGEKIHEILISEEEAYRSTGRGNYYVVQSVLPELRRIRALVPVKDFKEYSSNDVVLTLEDTKALIWKHEKWALT